VKCFIASAFGHPDVDEIFRKAILPVLREFRITALRVDRVEHNEDIDDKIFSLLDCADFCVADLTYARPSVYYEAGHAFGQGKPVIYVVRDDHFRARPDDMYGNQRVHFDLQMKNIISWKVPDDRFRQRLRKRVKHVITPLLRAAKKSEVIDTQQGEFSTLSQHEQLRRLASKARQLLFVRGFKAESVDRYDSMRLPAVVRVRRSDDGICWHIHFVARPSLVRKDFDGISTWLYLRAPREATEYSEIRSVLMVAASRSTSNKALASWLPQYAPLDDKVFLHEEQHRDGEPRHIYTIAVLDGVKSVPDFTRRFRDVVAQLELGHSGRT
jgi:nucleoside 2-deoxyribosyltransferase